MSQFSSLQTDEHAALERVAIFARNQLIHAVDELLANFVGAEFLVTARGSNASNSSKRFDSEYKRFQDIAEVLLRWHSDDDFLAADGSPRPLRLTGKVSLKALVRRVAGSATKAARLLSDLVDLGLLDEVGDEYCPARRSAVLRQANVLNLTYATITATRLLRTISHNLTPGTPPLFERQVSEVSIRLTDLPVYLRFVEQQAQSLIDSADDWLSQRRINGATRMDSIKVGVGAFAWADSSSKSIAKSRSSVGRRTGGGLRR